MIKKQVELNKGYECKDGLTRYVILMIKLGMGYCVVWDSVPRETGYWSDIEGMQARQKAGLRGSIGQAKFLKMIINKG